jgi:predicted enzyme related to lactoylglutathione lyase
VEAVGPARTALVERPFHGKPDPKHIIQQRSIEMAKNPVVWFEIYVQNMERAKKFYENVLAVRLEKFPSPELEMCFFPGEPEGTGAPGALAKMEGVPSGGSTLVYFRCEDCAVEAARVVPAGGKIHREKWSIGEHGFIALAVDTEGNMFGLHSRK